MPAAGAQELMGLRLGKDRLSDALARIGLTPLVQKRESADELCYRAEVPFEETWVVLSSGAVGKWDVLTSFRVLSSAPAGMTCRPTPLISSAVAIDGIRKGMTADQLRAFPLSSRAQFHGNMENGRLTSFEVTLE